MLLYYTMIHQYYACCNTVRVAEDATDLIKLMITQKKILRKSKLNAHTTPLNVYCNLLSVSSIYTFQTGCFAVKVMNNMLPSHLSSLFTVVNGQLACPPLLLWSPAGRVIRYFRYIYLLLLYIYVHVLINYQWTFKSGERFLLITANFFIVYLGSHVTPKRTDRKEGVEASFWVRVRYSRFESGARRR